MKKVKSQPFNEVYSQKQIDEVDNRIMKAKKKYDAKLYANLFMAKDFAMNN